MINNKKPVKELPFYQGLTWIFYSFKITFNRGFLLFFFLASIMLLTQSINGLIPYSANSTSQNIVGLCLIFIQSILFFVTVTASLLASYRYDRMLKHKKNKTLRALLRKPNLWITFVVGSGFYTMLTHMMYFSFALFFLLSCILLLISCFAIQIQIFSQNSNMLDHLKLILQIIRQNPIATVSYVGVTLFMLCIFALILLLLNFFEELSPSSWISYLAIAIKYIIAITMPTQIYCAYRDIFLIKTIHHHTEHHG